MKVAAIIVAGGSGERFGRTGGKQLAEAGGRPLLAWSASALASTPGVMQVVVVAPSDRLDEYRAIAEAATGAPVTMATAGSSRSESVRSGLSSVRPEADLVAVHDGARPLVTPDIVAACIGRLKADERADGAIAGQPCVDTVKTVDANGIVTGTPDRSALWTVQTPQVFRADAIRAAHESAAENGVEATDDAALVERCGGRVVVVASPRANIKVTLAEDLEIVDAIIRHRGELT